MQLPPALVWRPDLVVINTIDGQFEVAFYSNVITRSNGQMLWAPPAFYSVYCSMDATFFPYDEQSCDIKFASLAYSSSRLRLVPKTAHADFSDDYSRSSEWDVISSSQITNSEFSEFDRNEKHDILTMRLNIKRKPLFYSVNLVMPITLVFGISLLTFFIPCHCHEKIALGTTVLLALIMLQLIVSEIIPVNSRNLPMLAFYLLFAQIMIFVSLLFSVISMSVFYRGPKTIKIPAGLKRKIFFVWPKYLWLDFYPTHFTIDINSALHGVASIVTDFNSHVNKRGDFTTVEYDHLCNDQKQECDQHSTIIRNGSVKMKCSKKDNEDMLSSVEDVKKYKQSLKKLCGNDWQLAADAIGCVNYICNRTKRDVMKQAVELEWKFIALIVDRLLFLVYIFTIFFTLSSVLAWRLMFAPPSLVFGD